MGDLKNPKLIYLKAGLFLVIGLMSAVQLLVENPHWRTAALLGVSIWAFARLYYFMFYVIERYLDSNYRFSGIGGFVLYMLKRRKT